MGLATVLGLRKRGFFIPYRYADKVPGPGERPPYRAVAELFGRREGAFGRVLDLVNEQAPALRAIGDEPPPAPRWTQGWFPRLDAAVAYALVRAHRPRRVIEVGSGHSTRFLARAVADGGLETEITAVDPAPRASIEGLPVRFLKRALHEVDEAAFAELGAGDVLFVDSSHILMPGTDVDTLINRILPRLPAGAMVHVHDVFLPDDYPRAWAWRGYNEQQAVVPLLLGGAYEVVFASHYVASAMAARLATTVVAELPLVAGAWETSLWLRKAA